MINISLLLQKEKLLEDDLSKHVIVKRINEPRAYFTNIADIHTGLNNRKLFQETIKFILSVPNLYVGIGGDSLNCSTKLSKGNVMEETLVGDQQIYALVEDIRPLVENDRLLYIIEGNHTKGRVQETTFITLEMLIASLLGKPELYKHDLALVYFNINKNFYSHFIQHKSGKAEDKFSWVNADCVWREHVHLYKALPKIVLEQNKYAKKPIVKTVWEVYSGSFQVYPNYAKANGYRPLLPGCMIAKMNGEQGNWRISVHRDEDLFSFIQEGYKA